jgi:hypothetical protein
MAIQQGMTASFLAELPQRIHDFTTTGDVFKLALYTADASLGPSTTAYSATNEVPAGLGYTTGGMTLTNVDPVAGEAGAYWTFSSPITWPAATFTARAGLIYNNTKSNRAVAVLDFGADKTGSVLNGFIVTLPANGETTSILRLRIT